MLAPSLTAMAEVMNSHVIRSLNAGALKARAWHTLRAAVQGVTSIGDGAYPGGIAGQELPRMRRGTERC